MRWGRINNAGVAGEGSREGYEAIEDPVKFSQQLLKSEYREWLRIYETNVISYYVRFTRSSLPSLPCVSHRADMD